MSCDRCNDLCIIYPIRTPGELKKALVVVADNLRDGTLGELPAHPPIFDLSVPFASVVAGTARPDLIAYRFCCNSCGETFSLTAETYHGSGGSWHPEREGASREAF